LIPQHAALLSPDPIAPAWLVLPVAVLAMLVVAGHVLLLYRAEMPPARKRIRTVNSLLMMFTIPLTAAAFSLVPPAQPHTRLFVMLWMLVAGLIVIVLFLAMVDIVITFLAHRAERAELRRQIAAARAVIAAQKARQGPAVQKQA
jgi:cytochrome bd-type quinol oxidase subunit 2